MNTIKGISFNYFLCEFIEKKKDIIWKEFSKLLKDWLCLWVQTSNSSLNELWWGCEEAETLTVF